MACEFQKRNNLSLKTIVSVGKEVNIDSEEIEGFITLGQKIEEYGAKIFIMRMKHDFIKTEQIRTISSKIKQGENNFKDLVSVLLFCNMYGTYKKIPFLIGRSKIQDLPKI